jgi:hypothetical protein
MGDTARCRDIWLALRVDESVSLGSVVENRVRIESSDPVDYPTNEANRRTTVGTAKIDTARLLVGEPGRDGFTLRVDIGRAGSGERSTHRHRPSTRVVASSSEWALRERRSSTRHPAERARVHRPPRSPARPIRCKLASRNAYAAIGLTSLVLDLPSYVAAQRSNARLASRAAGSPSIRPSIRASRSRSRRGDRPTLQKRRSRGPADDGRTATTL